MRTNKEEGVAELAKALIKVQVELKPAKKSSTNPFFKSSYADLVSVTEAAKPVLAKNDLVVSQLVSHMQGQNTLETVLLHSSGQWISSEMLLMLPKEDPQGQGSAITYARRYAFMAILGMTAEDEDDDAHEASKMATTMEIAGLKGIAFKHGVQTADQFETAIQAAVGKTVANLTKEDLPVVKQYLKDNPPNESEPA